MGTGHQTDRGEAGLTIRLTRTANGVRSELPGASTHRNFLVLSPCRVRTFILCIDYRPEFPDL